MKKISISSQNWLKCWRNLLFEFDPIPVESSIKSVCKALEERYSIISWYLAENSENYIVFYFDEKLITPFVLKWS